MFGVFLAVVLAISYPMEVIFAAGYTYVPKKYHGFYYCDQDSYYVVIIQDSTDITIRADVYSWGIVAAGDPWAILFHTNTSEGNNFIVSFGTWSKDSTGDGDFHKQTGDMILECTYNFSNHNIEIQSCKNGIYTYSIEN